MKLLSSWHLGSRERKREEGAVGKAPLPGLTPSDLQSHPPACRHHTGSPSKLGRTDWGAALAGQPFTPEYSCIIMGAFWRDTSHPNHTRNRAPQSCAPWGNSELGKSESGGLWSCGSGAGEQGFVVAHAFLPTPDSVGQRGPVGPTPPFLILPPLWPLPPSVSGRTEHHQVGELTPAPG